MFHSVSIIPEGILLLLNSGEENTLRVGENIESYEMIEKNRLKMVKKRPVEYIVCEERRQLTKYYRVYAIL